MRLFILAMIVSLLLSAGPSLAASKSQQASEKAARDYLKLGLLQAEGGNDEQAAEAFQKAVSMKPDWAEARSLLGSALARAGKYREAEEQLRKAVTIKPDYGEGWYYLGLFLKDRGKTQEAEQALQKAKQLAR
ncbi:MAG: tetratricopeptide repeat protein [Syntrophales bacterium]|nr:tetratricopeptide repeat protein [Syntrophales bacterium]MDD5640919.1 tetratricopeptide repeat protein [Syntrophales bacterium]